MRALVISSELLYQNLRRLSLNSAVDVFHFTYRLEEMVGCYADELLGEINNVTTIPAYSGANQMDPDVYSDLAQGEIMMKGEVDDIRLNDNVSSPSISSLRATTSTTTDTTEISSPISNTTSSGQTVSALTQSFSIYPTAGTYST